MKTPFTFAAGSPLEGCVPANGISVDSALVGVDPVAGDKRFICGWDSGGTVVRGLFRFVRQEDGQVVAVHVPGSDDFTGPSQRTGLTREARIKQLEDALAALKAEEGGDA